MSESQRGADLWAREAWQAEAGRWLDGQLNAAGIERTGDVTVFRIRPWAAVLRAPTSQGDVWLKAAGEVTDFEVRIYDVLYNAAPNRILKPIAVDADRGWLVLPDGGQPLRETTNGDALYEALADVAFDYGLLQREVTPHVERLVELGMMDMRPAAMPARFEEAATAVRPWVETKGSSDDRARFEAALRLQETFNGWCNRLASSPGGTSIDHNDLHPGNVLVGDDGRLTIYDWGDSVVAHPFASMLATFTTLRQHSEFAPDAPEILRIRDSYLRAFADLAPHQELVETLDLACRVAKVARALVWSQWDPLRRERRVQRLLEWSVRVFHLNPGRVVPGLHLTQSCQKASRFRKTLRCMWRRGLCTPHALTQGRPHDAASCPRCTIDNAQLSAYSSRHETESRKPYPYRSLHS